MFSRLPESLMDSGSGTNLNMLNSGAASTCGGNRLPAVNMISSVMLNRQVNRLTANAIIEAKSRVSSTVGTVMMTELTKYVPRPACSQAFEKFSKL